MRIYVGGLPFSTTSEQLEALFAEFGTVTSAQVIEDKYTRQSRGFGFVEMANAEEGNAAITRLHDSAFGGRNLIVNEARPREEGGGGRGGYGGRGGWDGGGWDGGGRGGDRRGGGGRSGGGHRGW